MRRSFLGLAIIFALALPGLVRAQIFESTPEMMLETGDNPFGLGNPVSAPENPTDWLAGGHDPASNKKTPVIIVPGIISSYLNKNVPGSPEAWPNLTKMSAPGEDEYLYDLSMNDAGWPNYNNIRATDIFRTISNKDIFSGLISELEKAGYEENENLFVFPYDWRLSIDWLAGGSSMPNTATLKDKIDSVLASTSATKVNVIAHSMGGLVTKAYMQKYGSEKVNKFIDIATPHLGSPYALKVLMFGDDMGFSYFGFGASEFTIKKISQNMPAIFDLLPSQTYQTLSSDNNLKYGAYIADIYDYDKNKIRGNLDYANARQFMKNIGLNSALLARAQDLHEKIDDFNFGNSYNIIGCGVPTVGKIYILNKEKSGGYEYGLKYVDGDGTVPLLSAEYLNTAAPYYNSGVKHGRISSADGVRQLVASLAVGKAIDLSKYQNLSVTKNKCGIKGRAISFHSPIDIDVYDAAGNHAGPDSNGEIENNIDGVAYNVIEGNKFMFLPAGRQFRIEGRATARGSFNARFQTVEDSEYVSEAYFNNVPLTTSTKILIVDTFANSIGYDVEGDGDIDQMIAPSAVLDAKEAQDMVSPTTGAEIFGMPGENSWYVSSTSIRLKATDDQDGSGVLKIEYQIDAGEWQNYERDVVIGSGVHNFSYASTDRAGNIEEPKNLELKIDTVAPAISDIIPSNEMQVLHSETIPALFTINDNISGVATDTISVAIDDQAICGSQVDLYNYGIGSHTLTITANDLAGNFAIATSSFVIVTNFDSTINDIARLYQERHITREFVKKELTADLEKIERATVKYQQKNDHRENQLNKLREKCLIKYHPKACNQLFDSLVELTSRNRIRFDRDMGRKFENVLSELRKYNKKGLVDDLGYDIIKNDINYLTK